MQRRKLQRLTLDRSQLNMPIVPSVLLTLTSEQKHYLCNVLRLGTGAEFIALDGLGHGWLAQIQPDLKQAQILAEIPDFPETEIDLRLAIAMPKGNTIESVIRQAAELGVRQILPMWSDRTVVKPNTALGTQKLERWQRIAQEATELSWQTYVPQIASPSNFNDLISSDFSQLSPPNPIAPIKLLCVTHEAPHLLSHLNQLKLEQLPQTAILIATGAEGGWTAPEEVHAIAHNWQPVSLGNQILSAITAPVVALAIIRAALEARSKQL
jgi:16S rRNA (uracil1498-N3)-methyltransferase